MNSSQFSFSYPGRSLYSFNDSHNLYVSDLDGTLLDERSRLSLKTRQTLIKIVNHHQKAFTVASARSLTTITEILGDLPLMLPVIQLNGALITDYHSREDLHQVFMEEKEIDLLLKIFNNFKVCFLSSVKEQHGDINRCLVPSSRNEAMEWFYQDRIKNNDLRIVVIPEPDYVQDYHPISFTVIEPHDRSLEIFQIISQELGRRIEIYPMGVDARGWEWTTLQHRNGNKGAAVEKLCEVFNFIPERVTVFGDNINDISMFNKKFKKVAVKNAHPLIKSKADDIIGDHRDNSVAQYVYKE